MKTKMIIVLPALWPVFLGSFAGLLAGLFLIELFLQ
jgi:hypothetical protein